MNSKELNLKLVEVFPEIKDSFVRETSWQDGNETGSHIVYADVFVPFIKKQISNKDQQLLVRIFTYVEELLLSNDEYTSEVIALSVLESLFFDEDVDNSFFIQFAKPKTLESIKEIIQSLEE